MDSKQEVTLTDLPAGTVTFLFTDIEGSTRLLQRAGDEYASILADHRDILRAAFHEHSGTEVDTQGDAFFVSFPRAHDAVMAAVQAQRALAEHPWPGELEVRVRMGLHTGEPLVKDSGYVGMDVHRAARLAHAGHGGQVLLSPTTSALVATDLPEDLRLTDLGAHRLKDLRRPVQVHQLDIFGLSRSYPPLRTLDSLPNNLPQQPTSYVGRVHEIEQLKQLLTESSLVTIAGPGGAGKTRLSLQVAAQLLDDFPDGVWFIELETVETPEEIVLTVAPALGFSIDAHSSDLPPSRQLLDLLSNKSMLIVLDNFEHLLDGAELLSEFQAECSGIKLLVTSREQLNVPGEWILNVSGMSFPSNGSEAGLESYGGVSLFLERARQVEPDFQATPGELQQIGRICRMVEGLPLAIELAAAWIQMLNPGEIADEIEAGVDFLATKRRGVPDRHRSIRAVFNRSWELLPEDLQSCFRQLAVFSGGFKREAAQDAARVDLSTLLELAQKSLVRRDGDGRFELHPLISAYAKEKLAEQPGQEQALREAHSRWYVRFLKAREDDIQGERIQNLRAEIRQEAGNLRSAIIWALENWEQSEALDALHAYGKYAITEGLAHATAIYQRLADRLQADGASTEKGGKWRGVYAAVLAYLTQGAYSLGDPAAEALVDECLPALKDLDLRSELGVVLLGHGIRLEYKGQYAESIRVLEQSRDLITDASDTYMKVACLTWLGWAHYELGDYDNAGAVFQQAYRACQDSGNVLGLPYALSKLGTWADARHDYEQGLDYHRQAQRYFEAVGDLSGQGYAASRMSVSAWGMGDYEQALAYGRAGLDKFQPQNHRWGIATSLCRIGFAELELGELERAHDRFLEALRRSHATEMATTLNYALIGLGALWVAEGKLEEAVEVLVATMEHQNTPGLYRDLAERYLEIGQRKLGEATFERLKDEARSVDIGDLAASLIAIPIPLEKQV